MSEELEQHLISAKASDRAWIRNQFERLRAENAIMREALEFYAKGGNFNRDIWLHPELGFFTGKRAREIIKQLAKGD